MQASQPQAEKPRQQTGRHKQFGTRARRHSKRRLGYRPASSRRHPQPQRQNACGGKQPTFRLSRPATYKAPQTLLPRNGMPPSNRRNHTPCDEAFGENGPISLTRDRSAWPWNQCRFDDGYQPCRPRALRSETRVAPSTVSPTPLNDVSAEGQTRASDRASAQCCSCDERKPDLPVAWSKERRAGSWS